MSGPIKLRSFRRHWQGRLWRETTTTQVGSPAVRLRLARCTAWVKRWSEAMDFFKTIFKTIIFLSHILEICTKNQKVCKNQQKFTHHMTL